MPWEIEFTDQFGQWWQGLRDAEQDAITAAVEVLAQDGPQLGRPLVGSINGSRHANMKELRPLPGNIRIQFAFDPLRTAILLIGGDKTRRWREWYRTMIPIADQLYDEHLGEIAREQRGET